MKATPTYYLKMGLFFLFLLISSILLATVFYKYDTALVISLNQKRSPINDIIWLNIAHSAGLIAHGTAAIFLIASFFIKHRVTKMKCYTVALAAVISALAVTCIKHGVHRIRPFHLFAAIHRLGPGGGWSFPSGHTSDAFFLAVVIGLVYPHKKILVIAVYFWAILIGFSRIYLGVHYLSDVIAAVSIGGSAALCAFMVLQYFGGNEKLNYKI